LQCCTINCRAADIDQALLRLGRLMCRHGFERLDPTQATRLAAALGKNLPQAQDYSLAEIFSGKQCDVLIRPHMGLRSNFTVQWSCRDRRSLRRQISLGKDYYVRLNAENFSCQTLSRRTPFHF